MTAYTAHIKWLYRRREWHGIQNTPSAGLMCLLAFFPSKRRLFILTKSLRIHIFSFEWLRHRRLREECRLVYVVKRLSEGRKPSRSSLALSLSFSVSLTTRLESQLQIISPTTPATKLRGHLHGNIFFCSRTFSWNALEKKNQFTQSRIPKEFPFTCWGRQDNWPGGPGKL